MSTGQFRSLLLEINILLLKKLLQSTPRTLIDNFAYGADLRGKNRYSGLYREVGVREEEKRLMSWYARRADEHFMGQLTIERERERESGELSTSGCEVAPSL